VIRTVDLVVAGGGNEALATAAAALERGRRVLILLRSSDRRVGARLRWRLRRDAAVRDGQLIVVLNADVVCVDGIGGVEVVVVRDTRTGRLSAVNASAFLPGDDVRSPGSARRPATD